ncbi:MAG: class I SAM-dependent methyltransferase [Acidimicrobiales bacterium]|nr:class I SAM-dependent methyltransferase [Acidimicrobiales bacterium]
MAMTEAIEELLGPDLPIALVSYDGGRIGPADPPATIVVRSPDALSRLVTAPGGLGLARAYVAGDIDIEGDIYAVVALRDRLHGLRPTPGQWVKAARLLAAAGLRRLPPPPEEARLRGRPHSRQRDAAAIAHHYDVSNAFYRLVLGPSLTYSCAVFEDPDDPLEQAQANKHELICRKLGLRPGQRLLDVGCGWGGMVLHAARHHGVEAVGITLSARQAELAAARIRDAGLTGRCEVRHQDYREVADGPYDAISSIGMFEHVGLARLGEYLARLHGLLRPEGRLLNHGIARPADTRPRLARRGFVNRYVFPDGELHEVGAVVSAIQQAGFEARHVESLREHYALTLRRWVANLERSWEQAVAEVGAGRARVWRLYLAGSAANFETGRYQIHQVLAVRPAAGRGGLPLRPSWERQPLAAARAAAVAGPA